MSSTSSDPRQAYCQATIHEGAPAVFDHCIGVLREKARGVVSEQMEKIIPIFRCHWSKLGVSKEFHHFVAETTKHTRLVNAHKPGIHIPFITVFLFFSMPMGLKESYMVNRLAGVSLNESLDLPVELAWDGMRAAFLDEVEFDKFKSRVLATHRISGKTHVAPKAQ